MQGWGGPDVLLRWPGKRLPRISRGLRLVVGRGETGSGGTAGRLVAGDNLEVMAALLAEGYSGRFNLFYLDPPYGTDNCFSLRHAGDEVAYLDEWGSEGLAGYLKTLYPRLWLLRQLLAEDGTVYVHLDRRTCHYVKVLMDEIFGGACFRNVIVWRREVSRGRKAHARYFGNNVEYLLCYTKSPLEGVWNPVEGERLIDRDEARRRYRCDARGYFSTSHRGTYSDAALLRLAQEGRLYITQGGQLTVSDGRVGTTQGTIRIKYYLEPRGSGFVKRYAVDNLWDDIRGMAEAGQERSGYPTQKPERLLERVIAASSRPGDLVGDFYSGSGTTGVVAGRLGRRWVMVDRSPAAIVTAEERLKRADLAYTVERVERVRPESGAIENGRSCR